MGEPRASLGRPLSCSTPPERHPGGQKECLRNCCIPGAPAGPLVKPYSKGFVGSHWGFSVPPSSILFLQCHIKWLPATILPVWEGGAQTWGWPASVRLTISQALRKHSRTAVTGGRDHKCKASRSPPTLNQGPALRPPNIPVPSACLPPLSLGWAVGPQGPAHRRCQRFWGQCP